VVGALAAAVLVWRVASCSRQADAVQVGVVCTACKFHGPTEVSPGSVEWPVKCPKCGERAAHVAKLCPKCNEPYAADPKAPPTTCPNCKAKLVDEQL
jgi:DNA-directed RNA polymerase subunit RPC12/RpoP